MAEWLVSDIDDVVWERFKAKASAEGKSEEQLMLELIAQYAGKPADEDLAVLELICQVSLDPVAIIPENCDTDHGRY